MITTQPAPTFERPQTLFMDSSLADVARRRGGMVTAAVFGAPLDRTASFRPGAAKGPFAVRQMSPSLESYSPEINRDLQDISIMDLGNVPVGDLSMDQALASIADAMQHAAGMAILPLMIGGEHTVTLGAYRGIKRVHSDASLLHIDAHLDLRDQYEGETITHASWAYHAGQEFGFENIIQLGARSGAREEWPRARNQTAWSTSELQIPPAVRAALARRPIYLTIDIDVLDPAFAPGTGSPEPGGFSYRELAGCLYGLAGLRVVGVDVVEVAPELDPSGITAVAAAKLMREAILLFGIDGRGG